MRHALVAAFVIFLAGCSHQDTNTSDAGFATVLDEPVLVDAGIFVRGVGVTNTDCRSGICQHNENTDMVRWNDVIYLVHRTAESQILGPNSSLHIYRSTDEGAHFTDTATLLAPTAPFPGEAYPDGGLVENDGGRDLRDPSFFEAGGELHIKALTRLPVTSIRDGNVDTIAVESHSSDGKTWSPLTPIGPPGWSFWRIKQHQGKYYTAAYEDGDQKVALFTSPDGLTWTQGPDIFTTSGLTPLETELAFLPDGLMLALVRTDGDDQHLLGDYDLQTQVCRATPPYDSFTCDVPLTGVRLDGPVAFFWQSRLFVIARKHLGENDKKRTALYEITGDLELGPIGIEEKFELPSAGDTSYAGVAARNDGALIFSWYSSDVAQDEPWYVGMLGATDIWLGTVEMRTP